MTRSASAAAAPAPAAPIPRVAPTRGELVAELTEVVGAPHEARFIVEEALGLGLERALSATAPLPDAAVSAARAMAARRAAGEPLQYVFGHWPFRSLDLRVDERVLIPRPETEQVVEVALAEARRLAAGAASREGLVLADAGTGSGAIALALATELGPDVVSEVWATDASADALAVAHLNLEAVERSGVPGSRRPLPAVTLVEGSWLEPLPASLRGRVDLVVSNPPYVSEAEWFGLAAEVRCEPRSALVAGAASDGTAGLADVEAVLRRSLDWLRRPGTVVVELAPHQATAAATMAASLGYDETAVELDLAGRPRAWSPGPASKEEGMGEHEAQAGTGGAEPAKDLDTPTGEVVAIGAASAPAVYHGADTDSVSPKVVGIDDAEFEAALAEGAVVAVPGVGGYCLAVRVGTPGAEARLEAIAADPDGPHYAVGHRDDVRGLTSGWTVELERLLERCWPGPVDVFLPRASADGDDGAAPAGDVEGVGEPDGPSQPTAPSAGDPQDSSDTPRGGWAVTVGMPDGRALRRLCKQHGPWRTVPLTFNEASEVAHAFDVADVALVVDGGRRDGEPPTLVDATVTPVRVLREGALPSNFIDATLAMGARKRWFSRARSKEA